MKNLIAKLTSRKFWAYLATFVTAILIACNVDEGSVAQIIAIIGAFADTIAYLFAEGIADARGGERK